MRLPFAQEPEEWSSAGEARVGRSPRLVVAGRPGRRARSTSSDVQVAGRDPRSACGAEAEANLPRHYQSGHRVAGRLDERLLEARTHAALTVGEGAVLAPGSGPRQGARARCGLGRAQGVLHDHGFRPLEGPAHVGEVRQRRGRVGADDPDRSGARRGSSAANIAAGVVPRRGDDGARGTPQRAPLPHSLVMRRLEIVRPPGSRWSTLGNPTSPRPRPWRWAGP